MLSPNMLTRLEAITLNLYRNQQNETLNRLELELIGSIKSSPIIPLDPREKETMQLATSHALNQLFCKPNPSLPIQQGDYLQTKTGQQHIVKTIEQWPLHPSRGQSTTVLKIILETQN